MVFSSLIFLFLFLPVVLVVHWLLPARWRNGWLLAASLFFYAWDEKELVALMLLSITLNYAGGILMSRCHDSRSRGAVLRMVIVMNLGMLAVAKYANFLADQWNVVMGALGMSPVELDPIPLPIGISFFTFQAMSYVVDVYRGNAVVQKNPFKVGLYIPLFPQLIAGPIVRYGEIAGALAARVTRWADAARGAERFIVGLAKKVLIANTLAVPVDAIFALPVGELTCGLA